ncbi:MAG: response regulator [Deltaproteobacteria bacterium]|nr:response regulator [Deltaproteobacteria bacterium]
MTPARVLIVDDDKDLRETIVAALSNHGLTILEAQGGEEAFDTIVREKTIDIVVCDLKMRKGGGFELLTKVRALATIARKPLFILITGYPTVTVSKAKELGAADLLSKPFDAATLKSSLSTCLKALGFPGI